VLNRRTYELRVEFRNYRPLITHLEVYRGDPRTTRDAHPEDAKT
jgi:conjugal transfer pilus assembly protein TraE